MKEEMKKVNHHVNLNVNPNAANSSRNEVKVRTTAHGFTEPEEELTFVMSTSGRDDSHPDHELREDPEEVKKKQLSITELQEQIAEAERAFRDLQNRYDNFVMRHYGQRYEPWFEEASDRYRAGIRKRYFRLLRLERELASLRG